MTKGSGIILKPVLKEGRAKVLREYQSSKNCPCCRDAACDLGFPAAFASDKALNNYD